jgi:hypothetical protein
LTPPGAGGRTRIRQHPERAVPEETTAILAAGLVAHVGIIDAETGGPVVIPMSYHYDPARPDRLWLHGSQSSRMQRALAAGAPVCVEVTLLDGLVASKSAKYHSMNYRSTVVFGRARAIEDAAEKQALFEGMIARYFPGRTAGRDYATGTRVQLDASAVVEVLIEEASGKARRGPPKGPGDDDPAVPGNAGVHPVPERPAER